MSQRIQDDLLTALLFQNIAEKYLECVKHEANSEGKYFVNKLINRLQVNRNDCYSKIDSEKGRRAFLNEFSQKDALQYANIFLSMIDLSQEQRDLIERVVVGVGKGQIIEFEQAENNY